jgi:dinuclear metal center YbgI/SA1388 family protein
MKIGDVIEFLEELSHPSLQESYDNAGLITGEHSALCRGILIALDATEDVIREAIGKNCNMVIAHHPIVFRGLKKINGSSYVERAIILAIKNDIAIYAIHTNLDNVLYGVNGMIAHRLGLQMTAVLDQKPGTLMKLYTYVPLNDLEKVRQALFEAGAGHIGNYSDCSFSTAGRGSFKAGPGADPHVGEPGILHEEDEAKLEVIFPSWLEKRVLKQLKVSHPYEEVAFEVIALENGYAGFGSGLIGELPEPVGEKQFLQKLHEIFKVPVVRHTRLTGQAIRKVAVCGGAGSFLTSKALSSGAQAFVSADFKYHEFFDAENRLLVADIGHYESEQYTIDLLKEKLEEKFPNFAVLKTGVNTNPVHYSCQ